MRHCAADVLHPFADCSARMNGMQHDPWRLDPSRFPKTIDLDLSEQTLGVLEALCARTGRPLSDTAADLLCQAIADWDAAG